MTTITDDPPAMICIHATVTERPNHVRCALGLYGGKPHIAVCGDCPKRQARLGGEPPVGVGHGYQQTRRAGRSTMPERLAVASDSTAVTCVHATAGQRTNHVRCALGLFGGQPHLSMCNDCRQRQVPPGGKKLIPAAVQPKRGQQGPTRNPFTLEQLAIAESRAEICRPCEHSKGVTIERNGWPVYVVGCRLCGCSALSLVRGTCRADKWPKSPKSPTAAPATKNTSQAQHLLLRSFLSPGDIVTLTTAVRDLHRAHPGRYVTAVETSCNEIWENNPHIVPYTNNGARWRRIDMHYPLVNQSNQRPVHFIHGYAQYLEEQLGVRIPVSEFRGDVHLSDSEKRATSQVEQAFGHRGPYWVIVAGGKNDFTAKWWSPRFYQEVVNHFLGRIQFVQVGETGHWHPKLEGVLDLVGKTSLRQFIRLMYHAEGVVCPVTLAMHLAAAVPTKTKRLRPCVVIAGGREPPHWEAYPGHQFLHTIGALPCCATGGCWKSRCQLVGDGDSKDRNNLCERPIQIQKDLRIAQCMMLIKPEDVIRAVERSHFIER